MAKQQCEPYKQGSLGNLLNTMQMLNTVEKDLTVQVGELSFPFSQL